MPLDESMRYSLRRHPATVCRLFASRVHAGLQVAEMLYVPNDRQASHEHSYPTMTLVVAGTFEEHALAGTHQGATASVVVKPIGVVHSDVYGPQGVRTLQIAWKGQSSKSQPEWVSVFTRYQWTSGG